MRTKDVLTLIFHLSMFAFCVNWIVLDVLTENIDGAAVQVFCALAVLLATLFTVHSWILNAELKGRNDLRDEMVRAYNSKPVENFWGKQ